MPRLSEEADQRSKVIEELEGIVEQQKEQWAAEIEEVKLQMELERLRQLDALKYGDSWRPGRQRARKISRRTGEERDHAGRIEKGAS